MVSSYRRCSIAAVMLSRCQPIKSPTIFPVLQRKPMLFLKGSLSILLRLFNLLQCQPIELKGFTDPQEPLWYALLLPINEIYQFYHGQLVVMAPSDRIEGFHRSTGTAMVCFTAPDEYTIILAYAFEGIQEGTFSLSGFVVGLRGEFFLMLASLWSSSYVVPLISPHENSTSGMCIMLLLVFMKDMFSGRSRNHGNFFNLSPQLEQAIDPVLLERHWVWLRQNGFMGVYGLEMPHFSARVVGGDHSLVQLGCSFD